MGRDVNKPLPTSLPPKPDMAPPQAMPPKCEPSATRLSLGGAAIIHFFEILVRVAMMYLCFRRLRMVNQPGGSMARTRKVMGPAAASSRTSEAVVVQFTLVLALPRFGVVGSRLWDSVRVDTIVSMKSICALRAVCPCFYRLRG